jgi:hypothetical protein
MKEKNFIQKKFQQWFFEKWKKLQKMC